MIRRRKKIDVEAARKLVSRAERRSLQKAEELRSQAEDLVKTASSHTVDAEVRVRDQFEAEVTALRDEMDAASRRATLAESELDLLRSRYAELEIQARDGSVRPSGSGAIGSGSESVQQLQIVTIDPESPQATSTFTQFQEKMSDDTDRLLAAAGSAAARLHSQAEIDLARARDDAVAMLANATREAEDLLSAAVTAIERDTAIARATREQAEREGEAAADRMREAEAALALAIDECRRLREEAHGDVEAARAAIAEESGRLREAHGEVEAARAAIVEEGRRLLYEAHGRAQRIIADGEREAAEAVVAAHRQLAAEISTLCDATDRTRDSVEHYLEATAQPEAERQVGGG